MKLNKFGFLPLAIWLFLGMFSILNAENTFPVPSTNGDLPYTCSLDAPTNLHSLQVGSTFIEIGWDQTGTPPTSYNVKAVKVSNGAVVYNMNFLNDGSHKFLLTNLPGGENLNITLTPKCANFEDGPPTSYLETTVILELTIVTLFPSNNPVDCEVTSQASTNYAIWLPDTYCEIPVGEAKQFKFVLEQESSITRDFIVENGVTRKIMAESGNANFKFCCEQNSNEVLSCGANYVTIKSGNTIVAKIQLSWNSTSPNFIRLFCSELNSNYKIIRLEPDPKPRGLNDGITPSNLTPSALSASPNPFNNTLEVKIPYATDENDVNISLYDLQGRLVLSEKTTGSTQIRSLSTADLLPGLYLMRVDTGDRTETIKVMKTQ